MTLRAARSWLFAPANHDRRATKALGLAADAVILDLEDAVAVAEKPATRAMVRTLLSRPRTGAGFVRVNAWDTEFCHADIDAVLAPGLDGIVLPKVESASCLVTIDWLISNLERERGLAEGSVDLMPIIETARGLANARAIASAGTRVRRLAFGAGDYTLDLGITWSAREDELSHARFELVLASRQARLEPPVDTVFIDIRDHAGFRASATLARCLGFQGKLCIHPDQVAVVTEVFTPSASEVERCRAIVDAFEHAERAGLASIQVDGYFVDYPIYEKAVRTLAAAGPPHSPDQRRPSR